MKLAPSSVIGILGGGQLGRMLALAGYPLGHRFRFYDSSPDAPASHLAETTSGRYDDLDKLASFASGLDVATYEFENVPVGSAESVSRWTSVYPTISALSVSQDRLLEKAYLYRLGIPTPLFAAIDSDESVAGGVATIGTPLVLKTRRMGYDGKGQRVLGSQKDVLAALQELRDVPLILEQYVVFDYEVSLIAVRGTAGDVVFYPLVRNIHRAGILRESIPLIQTVVHEKAIELQGQAQEYANRILNDLNYVGVLTNEFFVVQGNLLANEIAPRVHNSGHWTIEGCVTSQFENHIRAITGSALGITDQVGYSAMANIIGQLPDVASILSLPHAHLHLYDKEPRAGRKIGHVTINAPDQQQCATAFERVKQYLS